MDLDLVFGKKPDQKTEPLPERMVAPLPRVVPDDGELTFTAVETIRDVMDAPAHAVLLFGDHSMELLDVVVNHPDVMGFTCFVLSGLPTGDYHAKFEAKTYKLERVAFVQLVNDLVERKRAAAALKSETETPYDKERRQFTRADGTRKALPGAKIAGAPDEEEPDDDATEVTA